MRSSACFATWILLGGCNLLGLPGDESGRWSVRPGAIVFYGDTSFVEIADTVRVGEPFRVSATTFGDGCTRAAGMEVDVQGQHAVVVPLDSVYTPGPNGACTQELKELGHHAQVTFTHAGEARVVVRGIGQGPGTAAGEEVGLERTVVVR